MGGWGRAKNGSSLQSPSDESFLRAIGAVALVQRLRYASQRITNRLFGSVR
jgi:hypothetical protein